MQAAVLFAGLGGSSTAAEMVGIDVVWAANHCPMAVNYHSLNHPDTTHSCQDLQQADFYEVPRVPVILSSPCCQGHSRARGKNKQVHDKSRSTAWATVEATEAIRPDVHIVENVDKFLDWQLFPVWKSAFEALGYSVSPHILDAADSGVAQNRVRMYAVITKSKSPLKLQLPKREIITARSIIDMDSGRWSDIHKPGRSPKTLAQIARGRRELGTDEFVIPYYGRGSGETGRSLDRPLGTVTTRDRWAVICGDKMRMLTVDEYRQFMSFPKTTILPGTRKEAIHLLGNAVAPLQEADLLEELKRVA